MKAANHDRLAAYSQGITHFIGRALQKFNFQATTIDTLGAKRLHQVKQQTCNDSWQLFVDLQTKNPYTKQMRIRLGKSLEKIYNKLLPKRINPNYIVYGIQGGAGSFNHQAILHFTKKNKIKKFKIKYLYTTEKVLKALHKGNIDFGLFAIHNSQGGVVEESIQAASEYKFKIVKQFAILVRHFLMKRKDIPLDKIKKILTHPQVIKQCQNTLKSKYAHLPIKSGKGDLIDQAVVAKKLAENKLPKNIALIGPKNLAKLYNLEIIDRDLQDNKNNLTSFLLVSRQE